MQTSLNYGRCQVSLSDTICYPISQAKNMVYYAYKGRYCDTLINEYEKQAKDFIEVIQAKDQQLILSEQLIYKQRNEIDKQTKKIRFWQGATGVTSLGFIFLAIFR